VTKYVVRRLVQAIPLLLLISVMIFLLMQLIGRAAGGTKTTRI
jgi:ABC-type dipeptide/oligopeptide/nickel transport system permease component